MIWEWGRVTSPGLPSHAMALEQLKDVTGNDESRVFGGCENLVMECVQIMNPSAFPNV